MPVLLSSLHLLSVLFNGSQMTVCIQSLSLNMVRVFSSVLLWRETNICATCSSCGRTHTVDPVYILVGREPHSYDHTGAKTTCG